MRQTLRVGDRLYPVSVGEEGKELRLEAGGVSLAVRVVSSSPGRHLVEVGGGLEILLTARAPGGTFVFHRGRVRFVEEAARGGSPAPHKGAGAVPGAAARGSPLPPGAITPPTPAVVVAVLVEAGQAVPKGAPLLVLSAMKTETQLVSPFAGRVRSVAAAAGARVRPGQVLLEVEPEPEGGDRGG